MKSIPVLRHALVVVEKSKTSRTQSQVADQDLDAEREAGYGDGT